jgi:tRNA (guanine-N7-)-methyltransferase
MEIQKRRIRSFVLRAGRQTAAQKRSYEKAAGSFCIPYSQTLIDYSKTFGNENPVIIEIGFGMGIATARIAEANPDKNYLGIEVHRPGIGRLLWEIEKAGLANIRIIEHDAVETIQNMIPQSSAAGIHIFFPDPWPKKRHHKRRLVTQPFTGSLAGKLQKQGYLYMVTDWEDYAIWALRELEAVLVNSCAGEGFAPSQLWRPKTKFEEKGLAKGHKVRELLFVKE